MAVSVTHTLGTHTNRILFTVQMVVVWLLAFIAFYFFREFGIEEFSHIETSEPPEFAHRFLLYSSFGVLTGILYGLTERYFERPQFARQSYGKLILLKSFAYFILLKVLFFLLILLGHWKHPDNWDWSVVVEGLRSKNYWVTLIYLLSVSTIITFVGQMNQKFGPGILWNMVTGKYRNPKEEERIFMFLDLRSSTSLAERLGHVNYSRLIQACFIDMTGVLIEHKAEIYQYVGDEVVLSWTKRDGLKNAQCIRCFFAIQDLFEKRRDEYEVNHNTRPVFKAGIHLGWITVAEVGIMKREICYHGDVLNTTARIEGCCNRFGRDVLISEDLRRVLGAETRFHFKEIGHELLRGKQELIAIFGVEQ